MVLFRELGQEGGPVQRGDMIHIWLIRYSDGTLECSSEEYGEVIQIAEDHIKGTDLTYVVIE